MISTLYLVYSSLLISLTYLLNNIQSHSFIERKINRHLLLTYLLMVTYGGFPTQVLSGPLRRTPNLFIYMYGIISARITLDATQKTSHISSHGNECLKTSDVGTCSNWTVKWYFDFRKSRCIQFWYGGCGGNENRYDSKDVCEKTCVSLLIAYPNLRKYLLLRG